MTTQLWARWDADRQAGKLPTEMARELDDSSIAALVSDAGEGRDDERKLLAAETLRRINDLHQIDNDRRLPPDPGAHAHRELVNRASERIHAAERKLERASAAQVAEPDLKAAHQASLLAEEHRAHVETSIERRAEHRAAVEKLKGSPAHDGDRP